MLTGEMIATERSNGAIGAVVHSALTVGAGQL